MNRPLLRGAVLALVLAASPARAQAWRQLAAGAGTTARVLIIGAHPEDEDNALIAWLSIGKHVETAYLSITRGEAGANVAGNEKASALGVVRTAELLAERDRDGAHQYFTRAYDFGFTKLDSVVDAGWPHDSLVHDVVSVVRAFRPHVIISLFGDSTERDATHRVVARLAREAFALAGDMDRLPAGATSLLPAWTVSRLLTRLDSAGGRAGLIAIDVGEFDRVTGRSYAELGADIRRLQRTQPQPPPPPIGHVWRFLRLDATRTEGPDSTLFGLADTSLARFRAVGAADTRASFDTLVLALTAVRERAPTADADSIALALAPIAARAASLGMSTRCRAIEGVPACLGVLGDFASSLGSIRDRAARAMADAANIVIDGTVDRALVAERDGVPLTVTVFNGGKLPFVVRQLSATSRTASVSIVSTPPMPIPDSAPPPVVVPPDSAMRWTASVGVNATDFHWWQFHGLAKGTWLHLIVAPPLHPVIPQLISGEDRIPTSGVDATITIAGSDVRLIKTPLAYRAPGTARGDDRHPLTGVPPISVLTERGAEYERAGLPLDRLFRVYLSSAHNKIDTVTVELMPPVGLKVDSAKRIVVLSALGSASVFFRLRGTLKPGQDSAVAVARLLTPATNVTAPKGLVAFQDQKYELGAIARDYPHIPSQQFQRPSTDRIEIVDMRVPPRLRVGYIKGADDMQSSLGQLQINVQAIEPSLVSVLDLSGYSTILIGSGALVNDALAAAIPALRDFMRKGGTLVVMPGGREVATSGLVPYPIVFDSMPTRLADPTAEVRTTSPKSLFLAWPNAIAGADFENWSVERARGIPISYDARYRTVLSMNDPGQPPTAGTILSAPVGKGLIVYTSLSLDTQLAAVNPGAARLLVNLLSAGLEAGTAKK